jgi:hypothetical protein
VHSSIACRFAYHACLASPSRQIEAEQRDAVQAGLDKQPIAKAALGT